MRSQCQPSSWNGHRNVTVLPRLLREAWPLVPRPDHLYPGAAQLSGNCSGPGPSSGATLSPACSGPSDRMAPSPVLLEQGSRILGSKQAELALGGVKKKKEFFLEVCQGFTKTLEGCLT